MANPTLLDMPIARDGNKNTIPTTDNGTTGLLSQQYGWQLINAIPPQQGGKAVKREDFNGALYLLSNLLFYLQKGWQFEWDANQNYYAGCIVKDPNNGKMYQRLNDGTSNTAPHSDTTNWKLWDLSMLANYLPLSGGNLTGGGIGIKGSGINSLNLEANELDAGTSAGLHMFSANAGSGQSGVFELWARNIFGGNNRWILRGEPNGALRWINANSNTNNDLGGSAIVARDTTYNTYVKYASGLIIQRGSGDIVKGTSELEITFPISFSNGYTVVAVAKAAWAGDDNNLNLLIDTSLGISKFKARIKQATDYGYAFDWIAMGY